MRPIQFYLVASYEIIHRLILILFPDSNKQVIFSMIFRNDNYTFDKNALIPLIRENLSLYKYLFFFVSIILQSKIPARESEIID